MQPKGIIGRCQSSRSRKLLKQWGPCKWPPKTPFVSPSLFQSHVSFRHVLESHDLTAPLTLAHIHNQGPSRCTGGGPFGSPIEQYIFVSRCCESRRVDRLKYKGSPSLESNQGNQFKVYNCHHVSLQHPPKLSRSVSTFPNTRSLQVAVLSSPTTIQHLHSQTDMISISPSSWLLVISSLAAVTVSAIRMYYWYVADIYYTTSVRQAISPKRSSWSLRLLHIFP